MLDFLSGVDWPLVLLWTFCILGLLGSLIPMIPGSVLIVAGCALFMLVEGSVRFGWGPFALIVVLFAAAQGAQYVVSAYGAKRMGASGWGTLGAAVGMMIGTLLLFFIPPTPFAGMLIGAFAGAVTVELLFKKKARKDAFGAGIGAAVGAVVGLFVEFFFALAMLLTVALSVQ